MNKIYLLVHHARASGPATNALADAVLPGNGAAAEATMAIRAALTDAGTLVSPNETSIVGHAIAVWCRKTG